MAKKEKVLDSPIIRIIDFLIDNEAFDYSKTEIAKGVGISRTTLHKVWKVLEDLGIVVETRKVGRAKMYKLNKKNPIVQKFIELDNAIDNVIHEKKLKEVFEKWQKI
ncbi:MAG: winged helix-turn-helix transcriptional regulator [Candidatus Odinarchaeota archaeon]|nr:winged helix-turn-helix transcriptional regulator [Candidatus Odinarchaeota archaeon]